MMIRPRMPLRSSKRSTTSSMARGGDFGTAFEGSTTHLCETKSIYNGNFLCHIPTIEPVNPKRTASSKGRQRQWAQLSRLTRLHDSTEQSLYHIEIGSDPNPKAKHDGPLQIHLEHLGRLLASGPKTAQNSHAYRRRYHRTYQPLVSRQQNPEEA